jgi:hypothetical protein
MNFAKPSDVLNLDSSALHPDFKTLWNVSIFQRIAYHSIFSIASDSDLTGKLVNSFQKILSLPSGTDVSVAWITVKSCAGYR